MERMAARSAGALLLLLAAGCATNAPPATVAGRPAQAGSATAAGGGSLPPVPEARGELRIDVVYPGEGAAVAVRDSTFIFGNIGRGNATLTINGAPVEVAPNGAWLAFLPVPADGVYQLSATGDVSEDEGAVTGCDLLLYPTDLAGVVTALQSGLRDGRLVEGEIERSIRRLEELTGTRSAAPGEWGKAEDRRWARELAMKSLLVLAGDPHLPAGRLRLLEIDDDAAAQIRPRKRAFAEILIEEGYQLGASGRPLVAVYADVHAGKESPGLTEPALERINKIIADAPDAVVVLFGHPRFSESLPEVQHLLCAWGGERLMEEAAAKALRSGR